MAVLLKAFGQEYVVRDRFLAGKRYICREGDITFKRHQVDFLDRSIEKYIFYTIHVSYYKYIKNNFDNFIIEW